MAMVWVLDLLHLQLQHCPFSPIEALIVSGRPFAISTDSACKKFIWIISYLRFGFSFALYVRMCSLASMWVSQQLSKTFLTVENLWCFHSFFFFLHPPPRHGCGKLSILHIWVFILWFISFAKRQGEHGAKQREFGVLRQRLRFINIFDCHCLWLWLSQKFSDALVGWPPDWLFDWGLALSEREI